MSSSIALIGTKVGMSSAYSSNGVVVPVTIVSIGKNFCVDIRTIENNGYNAFVICGGGNAKASRVNKPQKKDLEKRGCDLLKITKEFRADHFDEDTMKSYLSSAFTVNQAMKGALIDVFGTTQGKGFQGPMKRHGFGGLRASHGVSVSHRSHGSTGCRTQPGKVRKGAKMAGRMGGTKTVQQNISVYDTDIENGLLFLIGSVPGHSGGTLYITDAVKHRHDKSSVLNFVQKASGNKENESNN